MSSYSEETVGLNDIVGQNPQSQVEQKAQNEYLRDVVYQQLNFPKVLLLVQIPILAIFSYIAFDTSPTLWVICWLASASLCISLPHLARFYRPIQQWNSARKLALCCWFAFFHGLGLGTFLVFTPNLDQTTLFIFNLIVISLISGCTAVTNGQARLLACFSLPIVVCIIVSWQLFLPFEMSRFQSHLMSYLIMVFYFVHHRLGNVYRNSIIESLSQKYESIELSNQLSHSNSELEKAVTREKALNESKVNFLARASHDLRQPIHSLSLFCAALSLEELEAEPRKVVERMETSIDHLSNQMDIMLDVSKIDAGLVELKIETIDLAPLLENMYQEHAVLAEVKGIDLLISIDKPELMSVVSDQKCLLRVVKNLVSNAIKYTQTGSVEVSVFRAANGQVSMRVEDTGIGFSENEKAKIFEEFYQVNNPGRDRKLGLGLGLSIVKRLCDLMGHSVHVESQEGVGSMFEITLSGATVKKSVPTEIVAKTEIDDINLKRYRILCIDDEEDIRAAMNSLFKKWGVNYYVAAEMQEALSYAKNNPPDIVISDFRLAEKQDGLALIEQLRHNQPNLPAILLSGDTGPDRLRQATQADVNLVHKPVSGTQLLTEIKSALAKA